MVAAMGMSSGDIVGGSGEEDVDVTLCEERRGCQNASAMHQTSFPVTQALVSLLAANSSLIHLAGKGKIFMGYDICLLIKTRYFRPVWTVCFSWL